ncbi:MAG: hypothetical protein ACF8SC_09950 [Phycisphaerales bacterium JB037]
MKRTAWRIVLGAALAGWAVWSVGCASSGGHGGDANATDGVPGGMPAYGALGSPQLFDEMGAYTRKVTTTSPEAQRYFDQGLNWLFSFNHDEAVLSFRRAAELDPGCAMAWWGIAYAQGPNYNDPFMTPARWASAWEATQRAVAALDDETPVERALVGTLGVRYAAEPPEDASPLNRAFAEAMGRLGQRYPDDAEIATLHADALMVLHPWELYRADGTPAREQTNEIVRSLERVLARFPEHPGANHLYIHAIEPSNDKARAIPAADRLSDLVPASGHMRHMPAHIYVQVGMWDRAIEQSYKAMAADAAYRKLSPEQIIQHGYMSHNSHMLAFAAMMVGREEEAMAAAQAMWDDFPPEMMQMAAPFIDGTMIAKHDVLKRFGRWEAIVASDPPPDYFPMTRAIFHGHKAVAHAALGDFESAEAEQQIFREKMAAQPVGWDYGYRMKVLLVTEFFVDAEIALQRGEIERAIGLLEEAAAVEDLIGYGEPPQYLQPVRHTLGVAHLKNGDYASAARVYQEDLDRWPGNGWSLLGLSQALAGLGDEDGAQAARERFEKAWHLADEMATSSCKCVEMAGE